MSYIKTLIIFCDQPLLENSYKLRTTRNDAILKFREARKQVNSIQIQILRRFRTQTGDTKIQLVLIAVKLNRYIQDLRYGAL